MGREYPFIPQLLCVESINIEISSIRSGRIKTAQLSRHLGETYIKVKGKWCYLYRAMDTEGRKLDF